MLQSPSYRRSQYVFRAPPDVTYLLFLTKASFSHLLFTCPLLCTLTIFFAARAIGIPSSSHFLTPSTQCLKPQAVEPVGYCTLTQKPATLRRQSMALLEAHRKVAKKVKVLIIVGGLGSSRKIRREPGMWCCFNPFVPFVTASAYHAREIMMV